MRGRGGIRFRRVPDRRAGAWLVLGRAGEAVGYDPSDRDRQPDDDRRRDLQDADAHLGYALSTKHRKKIEEAFGWAKTVGGMAHTMYRGIERVRSRFILTMAANNLARLPRLLTA
ncbi:MAG: transposase [Paracoccaceae bacterium]